MEEFTRNKPKSQLKILDAGSGIGIGTAAFVKLGAGHAVGIDKSQAMTRYAKEKTIPSTTLTDLQKQDVEFRTFDLQGPGAAAAAEFTSACLLYFSVYYFKDLDNLFRNLALWVQPGGTLAIEVVNKYNLSRFWILVTHGSVFHLKIILRSVLRNQRQCLMHLIMNRYLN